ncbi:MAG: C1 family peptidase [Eubacterium sp.]|nr:C1 family peptidase [Eubacterium sp.]
MKHKILLCVIVAAIIVCGIFTYTAVREHTKNQSVLQTNAEQDEKEDDARGLSLSEVDWIKQAVNRMNEDSLKAAGAPWNERQADGRDGKKLPDRAAFAKKDAAAPEAIMLPPETETGSDESGGQSVITGQAGDVPDGNGGTVIPDDLPAKSLEEDKDNADDPDSDSLKDKDDSDQNPEEEDPGVEEEPDDGEDSDDEEEPDEEENPDDGVSPNEDGKPYITLAREENEINPATGKFYKYNANQKGFVTSVKNQGEYNTCWSFAAVSAAESALLAQAKAPDARTLDLSELQLSYFFYHNVPDQLNNTAGDTTTALNTNYLAQGGNEIFATFAMANRTGLTSEADLPYEAATDDSHIPDGYLYDQSLAWSRDLFHLENAFWIAYADTNVMKQAIIDFGAVSFQFYFSQNQSYYNRTTYGYYCPDGRAVNHAAVIVGWDDDYSRKNFAVDPGRDGAWLVKNSYGDGFGESGYLWISYADTCFSSVTYKAYVFDTVPADGSTLYQYDGANGYLRQDVPSSGRIANVFTAAAPGAQGTERLEAVSFALYDTYVNYDIQVYRLSEEAETDGTVINPEAGEPCISEENKVSGQTKTTGYYTVRLKEPIVFAPGEKFAVVVTLGKNDGSSVEVFVDGSYTNGNWIRFVNIVQPGQSFLWQGDTWNDLYDDRASSSQEQDGLTVRLKAITVPQ